MGIIVKLATILSPVIAVLIAVWTSRKSAKDTEKKIVALEDSTTKQIENVKNLARIQIEIAYLQLQKELTEARGKYLNASEKSMDAYDDFPHIHDEAIFRINERKEKRKALSLEQDFYSKQVISLNNFINRLNELKNELD